MNSSVHSKEQLFVSQQAKVKSERAATENYLQRHVEG